jgi:hypothetical protein
MKQLRIFAILMTVFLMAACNKSADQSTGAGDVMIVAKQSGPKVVYGISIYAYTLSSFSSVSVVSSADPGKTYTLKANQGYKTSFYYETPEAEFTATKPAAATFNFSATFENGVNQTFQNILTDKVLPIPTFENCVYNATTHQLEVKWTLIQDASSYSVSILDDSKLVFGSFELPNTQNMLAVSAAGNGWATGFTPESGKTYTIRLYAYLHETTVALYNMQSTSIVEKTVVWGN